MQNRERVPLFPLSAVINRGKSFASNTPQAVTDPVTPGWPCPLAGALGHPPELPRPPGAPNITAAPLPWGSILQPSRAKADGKNSTSSFDNGFKDAGETQNENSPLF